MAQTASSNLARLLIIPETVFGVTPSTGDVQTLRFTGESLQFGITTETSQEIRSDRQISDLIQVGAEASGDVNFELSYGTYDALIAAALGGTWATNKVQNGTLAQFFSIEQGFTDINQHILYKGMGVNSLNLEFSIDSIISGSVGFMGAESIRHDSSEMPGTPQAPTSTSVMDSVSGFADLMVAGQSYPCGVSRVTLNVDAALRAQRALGKMGACAINLGTLNITGEIVVYFSDGILYDKFIANEDLSLTWTVKDKEGNQYKFNLPRIKFSDGSVNAGSLDQDVELTLPYQAIFDPTSGFTIEIERVPVTPGP